MYVIGKEENGIAITIDENSVFQLELPMQGNSGSGWFFDALDESCLEVVYETTKERKWRTGILCHPLVRVWQIRAKKEARTELRMLYYRAWEGKETASERFSIVIDIRREKEELSYFDHCFTLSEAPAVNG